MTHVSQEKKDTVEEFKKLFLNYPIVAAVNMENLPAKQLQTMRSTLRDKVILKMTKRRLIKIVIEEIKGKKPGIEKLLDHMKHGMPALLFTKENPFKLYNTIQKNKSPAPAKAGQIAPRDIVVKAGVTPFLPGPIIGELGAIGVKTGVEGGKVSIKADTVVCREGQEIKPNVASMLLRLNILPMEIGLDIPAIYEGGIIYKRDVLSVDPQKYVSDITVASRWALNLSIEAGYTTKENIEIFIGKAFRNAKAVVLESAYPTNDMIADLIGRANNQMMSLKNIAKLEE